MNEDLLKKIDLQWFAEDPGNDDSDHAEDKEGEKEEKKFSQSELNAILAKEGSKKTLKELGYGTMEELKEALAKQKEPEKKTDIETQKPRNDIDEIKKQLNEMKAESQKEKDSIEKERIESRLESLGISSDYMDMAVKSIFESGKKSTKKDAEDFLKKYPVFLKKEKVGSIGGKTNPGKQESTEDLKKMGRNILGLTK